MGTLAPGARWGGVWLGGLVAAALSAICLVAGGGLALSTLTAVEIALTLGGALLVAAAIAQHAVARAPLHGAVLAAATVALAALTAASVIWSLRPDQSFIEGGRTFAYAFALIGSIALVRLAPGRWSSVLGGVLLATVIASAYAVGSEVFPAARGAGEVYSRLREPFGYWNAVGLMAALGVPPCLWFGARRSGHGAIAAIACPALTVLLVALMLASSRGALLALVLGCAFWFGAVPLRLRGAFVLLTGALTAAGPVVWAYSQHALTTDNASDAARTTAGQQLGLLLAAAIVASLLIALGVRFAAARRAPRPCLRRRAGVALLVALALVPVALGVALSFSSRGLGGSISHSWRTLTDPNAVLPPNDPSRLTAVGSVRARYWRDALEIFSDHPALGAGAGAYDTARAHYRTDVIAVAHAHGYLVQTLADLGLVGLLISLLAAGAWIWAAIRSANPFGWRARAPALSYGPERIGLLTLTTTVLVFAVHSTVDWTWLVPGNAAVALLCAGWVAGRGPRHLISAPAPSLMSAKGAPPLTNARKAAMAATVAFALTVAWSQWQPQSSATADAAALAALARHDYTTASADAHTAAARDPVSVEPLFDQAVIDQTTGNLAAAHTALESAVKLQPSNAATWERLADFELISLHDRSQALHDLGSAIYLDPRGYAGLAQFLATLRTAAPVPSASNPHRGPGQLPGGRHR